MNALLARRSLARVSNTPCRTRESNYFTVGDALYVVDMPGYGYAKAPKSLVKGWTELIHDYLRGRPQLKRVMLLIDSRHGLKSSDNEIMTMLDKAAVSYQAVLTKADKPRAGDLAQVVRDTEEALRKHRRPSESAGDVCGGRNGNRRVAPRYSRVVRPLTIMCGDFHTGSRRSEKPNLGFGLLRGSD